MDGRVDHDAEHEAGEEDGEYFGEDFSDAQVALQGLVFALSEAAGGCLDLERVRGGVVSGLDERFRGWVRGVLARCAVGGVLRGPVVAVAVGMRGVESRP